MGIPGDQGNPLDTTPRAPRPPKRPHVARDLAGAAKEDRRTQRRLGASSTSTTNYDSGRAVYEADGDSDLSIDVPAGTYAIDATLAITFDVDSGDQYLRIDLAGWGSTKKGSSAGPAPADLEMVAECSATAILPAGGTLTLTPTFSGGPGAEHVTAQVSTLRATRLGPA